MAVTSVLSTMTIAGKQGIPAFFRTTHDIIPAGPLTEPNHVTTDADSIVASSPPRKRRRAEPVEALAKPPNKSQRTLKDILNPQGCDQIADNSIGRTEQDILPITQHSCLPITTEPADSQVNHTAPLDQSELRFIASSSASATDSIRHPIVHIPVSPVDQSRPDAHEPLLPRTTSVKVLRLSANGTFSSPSAKEGAVSPAPHAEGKRRLRTRNLKSEVPKQALLVRCRYGQNGGNMEQIGQRIDGIMRGEEKVNYPTKAVPIKKSQMPRKPFAIFAPKPASNPRNSVQEPSRKTSAVTPGKLRSQALAISDRSRDFAEPNFVLGSALLRDRLLIRQPGAKEARWPQKQEAHVRAMDLEDYVSVERLRTINRMSATQKRKGKLGKLPLPTSENVLSRFWKNLGPELLGQLRPDGFREPHPALRIPTRSFMSGHDILNDTLPKLGTMSAEPISDMSPTQDVQQPQAIHPALRHLFGQLPTSLTAWDRNKAENQSLAQKYAPMTSSDVLQPQREMDTLRQWLISHKVSSVETTIVSSKNLKQPHKLKRRRKRKDDLDDFLVDSDDDAHSMTDLGDVGELVSSHNVRPLGSMVQENIPGGKSSNIVLISGPHGCGKSAAAYAVAHELGFKVFEINSHERRSGKDVTDKIGDMTENHLVKHHGALAQGTEAMIEQPTEAENSKADPPIIRQGTVNAFFNTKTKTQPCLSKQVLKQQIAQAVQNLGDRSSKEQQQSLILLEEVDVLFREDKDFWTTILRLIMSSKRPFIMTCNDEDLVPLQAISLHAVLRFAPIAINLAVDYLLLVAAKEGHLLSRQAVQSLYADRGHDLRAALTELDFWCQMGIGDPRGGLTWLYQRWPVGRGMNEKGEIMRVMSSETLPAIPQEHNINKAYRNRPVLSLHGNQCQTNTILSRWHKIPASTWLDTSLGIPSKGQRRAALEGFEAFANAMSDADLFSSQSSMLMEQLVCDSPVIREKSRGQYIEGLRLLQTDVRVDHHNLSEAVVDAVTALVIEPLHSIGSDRSEMSTRESVEKWSEPIPRASFGCFDAIACPEESPSQTNTSNLYISVFDGPLRTIATDVAPYVRHIVHSELLLSQQREHLSALLDDSDGSRRSKRARTTRAARSALEGGQRATTRREHWFAAAMDFDAILATGGQDWSVDQVPVDVLPSSDAHEVPMSSLQSTDELA